MIPKQAIEKAIEGGWKESLEIDKVVEISDLAPGNPDFYRVGGFALHHADMHWLYPSTEIALDPSFWRSLGKVLGWVKKEYMKDVWLFEAEEFRDAFARELIDHVEHAILSPVVGPILDEVIGPDVVRVLRPQTDA
jgi:hypothetical protein